MRAYDGYNNEYINWATPKVADGYGTYSGADPNNLREIVINRLLSTDKRYFTYISSDYKILEIDDVIIITSLSSGITITLPYSPNIGDSYSIKDSTGVVNMFNITFDGYGEMIDGYSTITTSEDYFSKSFVYDGYGWNIL
jgi:hypothetical protein